MSNNSHYGPGPVLKTLNYLLLAVFTGMIVFPIVIIVNTSLKTGPEYLNSSVFALPKAVFWGNYGTAIAKGGFPQAFLNTGILMAAGILGSVGMGLFASFVLSRYEFRMKKIVLYAFLFAMVIPQATIQTSIFLIIKSLNLYNTIFAGIVLYMASDVLQVYMFLQYMNKIPISLDESAKLDGASTIMIVFRIIIPQMVPAIVTVALIKGLAIYNDMLIQVLYMSKMSLRTVSTALMKFFYLKEMQWNLMMAAIVVVMIPTLLIYALAQKHIISGTMTGAVKD